MGLGDGCGLDEGACFCYVVVVGHVGVRMSLLLWGRFGW